MPYKYYNTNPNGYHIPDCVIRAISTAMNIDYYGVLSMLHKNGKYYDCNDLSVRCYEKLLDFDFNLPHFKGGEDTAEQIAKNFPYDIIILRMDGHLSVAINGVIHDIWDCSKEVVTDFWVVNK